MSEIQLYKDRLSIVEALFAMRQRQFDLLLEITRANNHNLPLKALVTMYEHILSSQLNVKRSALLIKGGENVWERISYNGKDESFLKLEYSNFLKAFEETVEICPLPSYFQSEFDFLIPVLLKGKPIGYVFAGDIAEDKYDTKEEKLKFIQTLANTICSVHENSRLSTMELQQKIMQRDLQLASEMQRLLVPSKFPENNHFEISGFYKPFRGIGGDYYDFFKINDTEYFFCICDVSGKGIPAAMLMSNFQANIRVLAQQKMPLPELCQILNHSVYSVSEGDSFVTAFLGIINTQTGDCRYVNAGHTPSYVVMNGQASMLTEGCTILGALPRLRKVTVGQINLSSSALIFNYTDGIVESFNDEGEAFGEERLDVFVRQNHHLSPELFNLKLIQAVLAFCANDTFDDDLSLLTIAFQK